MNYRFSDSLERMKPSAIREIFKSLTDPEIISFAAGNPSPLSFPVKALAELSADIFANSSSTALQYGITEGYQPLRDAVEKRLREKFSIGRDFDRVIITSGGQQGIELSCKVLCNPGDTVLCEEPSFIGALNAFRSCGTKLRGLPMDEDGIDPDELDRVLEADDSVKLIYIISTFQNPSGISTSLEKRRRIYDVVRRRGVMLLEDNPYGELRFAGENIPTIKSMDDEGVVIYCSSFSKILSAGMRVGFVSAPEPVIQKMVVAKQCEDVHTNLFFQMLCHSYMTEYDFDGHIAEICSLYGKKCALMLSALDENMPAEVTYTRPEGGLFIWCTLPENVDMNEFVRRAIDKKVAVVPGTTFLCDESRTSRSFRLNYSTPSDEDIVKGIAILGDVAREMIAEA